MSLTLETAEKIVEAGVAKAKELGCVVAVAVADDGGYTMAVSRMEGGIPLTADVAENMAYTAAVFRAAGKDLLPYAEQPWFVSLVTSSGGKVIAADGLLPIVIDGEVEGGVGAAGGTAEEDLACCEAGLAAIAK